MSHPIDVGSVLGGRYKVTATVLTSHDQDLVLDGVDQVLNRPVSILVAGPGNADQVAQSAREVATGERPGSVQILDLGVSDATTYLITNHTSAADLLDLVVSSNPPYVEPFFTDTLGQRDLRAGPLPRTRNLRRALRRRGSRRRVHQLRAGPGHNRHSRRFPRRRPPPEYRPGPRPRPAAAAVPRQQPGRPRPPGPPKPPQPHRRRRAAHSTAPQPVQERHSAPPGRTGSAAAGNRRGTKSFLVVRRRLHR